MAKRRYWNQAKAERELSAWRRSGLSMAAYAGREGMQVQRLRRWRRRLEDSGAERCLERSVSTGSFLPVRIVDSMGVSAGAFEVVLEHPVRVRVPADFDTRSLTRLLGVLSGC